MIEKMGKKKIIFIASALVLVTAYTVACIRFSYSDNKTLGKQEPEGLKKLRPGLERVGKENDPLLREYILQEEAAKSKKTVNDYRLLFQSYRKNKTEFLPEYPKPNWSILAWASWFFKEVAPNKRDELLKNSFLTIIEKGVLITGALAVGKWLWESPQRKRQELYQALQITHIILGKPLQNTKINALETLNRDKVSLRGLTAEKENLNNINLQNAQLQEANLSNANLIHANLIHANLIHAKLIRAKLIRADLSSADLSSADLSSADLNGATSEMPTSEMPTSEMPTSEMPNLNVQFPNTLLHTNKLLDYESSSDSLIRPQCALSVPT
ncbi:pentapeptide repeat-containing protein [Scytonema sp. UIC 10036]|uniref:pentapeptide repeat-containing protein n=1 Tax=Scytonema sp. UIC 10036 TaxID=2304196 RepID=UPI00242EE0CC|nr:pentapeptide repeat-containing protein [Scytonema sp. UIC 10036]